MENVDKLSRTEELTALNAYTEGKMKRYGLLFSVNGGAFAIVKFIAESEPLTAKSAVLGGLQLWHLAIGLALFSCAMCCDIWKFGEMMSAKYSLDVFGDVGKFVLYMIGGLLIVGWLLAGFGGN